MGRHFRRSLSEKGKDRARARAAEKDSKHVTTHHAREGEGAREIEHMSKREGGGGVGGWGRSEGGRKGKEEGGRERHKHRANESEKENDAREREREKGRANERKRWSKKGPEREKKRERAS